MREIKSYENAMTKKEKLIKHLVSEYKESRCHEEKIDILKMIQDVLFYSTRDGFLDYYCNIFGIQ